MLLVVDRKLIRIAFTGYGATTLPSIYDALVFEKNTTLAEAEVERVSALLGDLTNVLVS